MVVSYGGAKYEVISSNPLTILKNKEVIGCKDLKKLGFLTLEQFSKFLIMLSQKRAPPCYLTEPYLRQLICQNLLINDLAIPYPTTKQMIKGLNYAIVKSNDTLGILKLLTKIATANRCTYVQMDHETKVDKQKLKNVLTYVSGPYGDLSKSRVSTIPLAYSLVLSCL